MVRNEREFEPGTVRVLMARLPSANGEFIETHDHKDRGIGPDHGLYWNQREDGFYELVIPPQTTVMQRKGIA